MWEASALISLAAVIWFWFDSLRAREHALDEGRRSCQHNSLQFLDETVECISLRLTRNEYGHVTLRRVYRFEFSDDGNSRRTGRIVMLGCVVNAVTMDPFLLR